jgi:hypothetical protein
MWVKLRYRLWFQRRRSSTGEEILFRRMMRDLDIDAIIVE